MTVPHVPLSIPSSNGASGREFLNLVPFWGTHDLERSWMNS